MKFSNQNLHGLAEKFYFTEYLSVLRNRKARKDSALVSHMNGFTLPNKPLERNLRNTLENLNPNVNPIIRQNIENILSSGDFIPDSDSNIENHVQALNNLKQFSFPDSNESLIRSSEETDFQSFMNNNPRTEPTSSTLEDQKEFLSLMVY